MFRPRGLRLEWLEDRSVPAGLTVTLADQGLVEGLVTTGTVTRSSADLSQNLTVQLNSSYPSRAGVQSSVVIPAGMTSATFPVYAVDDTDDNGDQWVTISANAPGPPTFERLTGSTQAYMTKTIVNMGDGRYYTAGLKYTGQYPNEYDLGVSRFLSNGQPDGGFGTGGTVYTDVVPYQSDVPTVMLTQTDGKILVAGYTYSPSYSWEADMFVVRYNTNGTLDTTFGTGGKVVLDYGYGTRGEVQDLTFGPNGKIVLAGTLDQGTSTYGDFAVVRLNTNGTLDTTWGGTGLVTTDFWYNDVIYEAIPDGSNRLVVVGQAGNNSVASNLAVVRYNTDGTLDATFGSGGKVVTDLPGITESLTDFIHLTSGKILAVGQVQPDGGQEGNKTDWVMIQYNSNGTVDTTFGKNGFVTYDFGGDERADGIVQMESGTFAVVGSGAGSLNANGLKPVVAQFAPNGTQILASSILPRTDSVGIDLVYQSSRLRLAGTSSSLTGGFVDELKLSTVGYTGNASLLILDNDDSVPLTAVPDAYDLGEDQTLNVSGLGVLANDYGPGGTLSASLVLGPSHGNLTLDPGGSFSYVPNPNYYGPDSFTYQVTDGLGGIAKADVSLTVWPMDDRIQILPPGPQSTAEDTAITFGTATGNAIVFNDIENPRVLVALLAMDGILTIQNTAGLEFPYPDSLNNSKTVAFLADDLVEANAALEGLVFTPGPNFNGSTYVSVFVQDDSYIYAGQPIEEHANITVSVAPVNDAPVAVDDAYEWHEDNTLNGNGLTWNDTDPEWDPLTAVLVSGPSHGSVTLSPNGDFAYTPDLNYNGPDSFTYRATDGKLLSNTATVSLTIWPMDDAIQVAVPGPQSAAEDNTITFGSALGSAIIVTDIENPPVAVTLYATDGILTLQDTTGLQFPYPGNENNSAIIIFYADSPAAANAALEGLVFAPTANFYGKSTLSVLVSDLTSVSYPIEDWDYVVITVTSVNDAPVAVEDGPYTVEAGESIIVEGGSFGYFGVLANDSDVDWEPLSAVLVNGPAHGTLSLSPVGNFMYTADPSYVGPVTFTYRATDGLLESNEATVTIQVLPPNQAPVSGPDAYSVDEDGSLTVAAPGLLGNDSDPESQPLSAYFSSGPAHGTLTLNPNGGFTYNPAANYNGPDGFWYMAGDGDEFGEPTFVSITVNPVNDTPSANPNSYTLNEDSALTITGPGVLANDTDIDEESLNAALVTGPSHGSLTLNADGGFTYTPTANYSGTDSFTYRAFDAAGADSTATVSLTVQSVNDAPVAVDDTFNTTEEMPVSAVVAGSSSLNMVSDPGDYIGQGQTWTYGSDATYQIYYQYPSNPTSNNAITVNVDTAGDWWYLSFHAPNNERFVPGTTYLNATRFPFNDDDKPGMDISGEGRGSNTLTGWFRVDEVAYGPAGEILVFAVTFEQHSGGATPALRGTVRYNAGGTAPGGVLLNDTDAEGDPLSAVIVEGPQHGQLYFNPNGTFMYVPEANYAGVDTFRYTVSDGALSSQPATVTINVAGVNDAPVNVVPGTQNLMEDATVTFSTANGNAIRLTDVDAGRSIIELRLSVNGFMTFPTTAGLTFVTGSNGGNIITVRGTIADLNTALEGMVFRPGNNFVGNFNLSVTTNDLGNSGTGGAKSDVDSVTMSITAVNDAPHNVVPLFPPTSPEDTPHSFSPNVWVTDVDTTTGSSSAPARVTLDVVSGGGKLSVAPIAGVTITGNDSDHIVLNGTISKINQSLSGLLFTPAADANNATTTAQIRMFTEDLANGGPGPLTDDDTFTVHFTPVNDAPLMSLSAGGVSVPMNGGTGSFTGFASGAVGPATATDELATQTLSFGVEVTGTAGSLAFASAPAIAADGTLTFTPTAGTWGTATVRVWASDGMAVTADQTFTVAVTNDAPTASGLTDVSVGEDTSATDVTLSGGFADLEDGPAALAYSVVGNSNPALFGSVSVAGGVLTFTPAANAHGSATLTVRATDSGGLWVESPLAVTVNPVNDAPTGSGLEPVVVDEDSDTVAIELTGAFADTEDGAALSFTLAGNTNPGLFSSVSVDGGVLTFTPAADAHGSATVTVRGTDSGGLWVDVPLSVTVNPVNDAPAASGLADVSVDEDASATDVTLTGGFADLEDGTAALAYSVVGNSNPALFGSVSVADGVLTFTPAANAHGSATLTVRATDSGGLWVESPLAVTVNPVNDAPTGSGLEPVVVAEDAAPVEVSLSGAFADIEDGSGLTFSLAGVTNPGLFSSVSISSGVLTVGFAANANGSATVTVRGTDSGGLWVDVPLSITVNPVNDAPTGGNLSNVLVKEDASPAVITLSDSFADLEDGAVGLTYSVAGNTNPALFGSVSVNGGVLTLAFAPNANGSANLTIRATDSGGQSVEVLLSVTVTPVNDAPTFVGESNVAVASNAGAQTVSGWAKSMSRGPADESGQTLSFVVLADNQLLFTAQPAINPATGALTFTPLSGASGMATVTVVLMDDGGTADGGQDASQAITFTITLNPPTGTPGVQIIGTELVITGGSGTDNVTIDRINGGNGSNGVKVTGTVNGQSINKTYTQTFTRIRVGTGAGNDTVTISDNITLPSVIDGGAGTDSLKGGGGSDSIFGGDANDTINGAAGDDAVDAGAGNDSVNGGTGRDILFGGTGNDTLNGGDGNDLLIGGFGADQLFGQNNNDILVAGSVSASSTTSDSLRQVLNDWDPLVSGIYVGLRSRIIVTDDPASVDNLQGGSGTDWFWSFDPIDVLDMNGAEVRN